MRDIRLQLTGIFKQITEEKQQLSLHTANEIRKLLISCAARPQFGEGVTHASVRLVGSRASCIDRPGYPRWIVFAHDVAPRLAQEHVSGELRNALVDL